MDRYIVRLTALVRAKLARKFSRRLDAEDVVLSAFRSFFVAAGKRTFDTGADGKVWNLLATFTMRKLFRAVEYHSAGVRCVGDEEALYREQDQIAGGVPPDHASMIEDEVSKIFRQLDKQQSTVVSMQLEGLSHEQIARQLHISQRTVRRVVARIRSLVQKGFPNGNLDISLEDSGDSITDSCTAPVERLSPITESTELPEVRYSEFVLGKMIGQGAFSKVYRAYLQADGRKIAVKFLKRKLWNDPLTRNALLREASIVSQLHHPAIVEYLAFGTSPHGGLFVLMELVDGVNLAQWRCTNRSDHQKLGVLYDVCCAIRDAHSAGVIHGDLSPGNILVTRKHRGVVVDFGMARLSQNVPTSCGGTLQFAAPEQLSQVFGTVDQRTDIYAIASIANWLLSETVEPAPFPPEEAVWNSLNTTNAELSNQTTSSIGPSGSQFLAGALEKEPCNRPCDLDPLIAELANQLDSSINAR